MTTLTTNPDHRARVLADAVISAYINEIAEPVRPRVQFRTAVQAVAPVRSDRPIGEILLPEPAGQLLLTASAA
jgi:hypothetical protein